MEKTLEQLIEQISAEREAIAQLEKEKQERLEYLRQLHRRLLAESKVVEAIIAVPA